MWRGASPYPLYPQALLSHLPHTPIFASCWAPSSDPTSSASGWLMASLLSSFPAPSLVPFQFLLMAATSVPEGAHWILSLLCLKPSRGCSLLLEEHPNLRQATRTPCKLARADPDPLVSLFSSLAGCFLAYAGNLLLPLLLPPAYVPPLAISLHQVNK